jgi:hypothetical protein
MRHQKLADLLTSSSNRLGSQARLRVDASASPQRSEGAQHRQRELKEMADLLSASSNQLAEILADWNEVLQQSKLGKKAPINNNERENGNAPRNRHLTGSRGVKSS